jgi:hypothetical protein
MRWPWQKKPAPTTEPFNEADVWSLIARLSPIARNFVDTPDVRVSFWAGGRVHVGVKLHSGSELTAVGDSLAGAVANLRQQSRLIDYALSPTDEGTGSGR